MAFLWCAGLGCGKTLSAVKTLKKLREAYPGAVVCSNLDIRGVSDVIPFTSYEQIIDMDNGMFGIIFLIDEIHLLWNSLESKSIPVSEIAQFCQMRKKRRIILGTSQVYSRVAKPIREQLKYVVLCNNYFKYFQVNTVIDPNAEGYSGESDGSFEGQVVGRKMFFHSPEDYRAYDTLNRISRIERKAIIKESKAKKKKEGSAV